MSFSKKIRVLPLTSFHLHDCGLNLNNKARSTFYNAVSSIVSMKLDLRSLTSDIRDHSLTALSSNKHIGNLVMHSSDGALSKIGLDINLAGIESTRETILSGDALYAVSRVDVLDKGNLVASR